MPDQPAIPDYEPGVLELTIADILFQMILEEAIFNPPKDRLLALYHVIKEAEARGLKFKIAKHVWETMKAGGGRLLRFSK